MGTRGEIGWGQGVTWGGDKAVSSDRGPCIAVYSV